MQFNFINIKQKISQSGMTLTSLMVGVAISSILLLALSELYQTTKSTFLKVSDISEVNTLGFQSLDYLTSHIQYAGNDFVYPEPFAPVGGTASATWTGTGCTYDAHCGTAAGTAWYVQQGWQYIGDFVDSGTPRPLPYSQWNNTMPACATTVANWYGDSEYLGMECRSECYWSYPDLNKESLYALGEMYDQSGACTDGVHNCGGCNRIDVYQKIPPHVMVSSNGSKGDIVQVFFAIRGENNNFTDCLGNPIALPATGVSAASTPNTNVPFLVNHAFRVSPNNTLQCQTRTRNNGVWSVSGGSFPNPWGWNDIFSNVEYLKAAVGVNDNLTTNGRSGTGSAGYGEWGAGGTVNRYVMPSENTSPLDPNRIVSIRLSLVVSGSRNSLNTAQAQTFHVLPTFPAATYPSANYTPPAADRLLRKLVTTTISFHYNQMLPYPLHCQQHGGTWYVKVAGIPWKGDNTVATDLCCGNYGCPTYSSFTQCEAGRRYFTWCEVFPPAP